MGGSTESSQYNLLLEINNNCDSASPHFADTAA